MLSIITCSRDTVLYENLINSIKKTIGSIAYEVIMIDNKAEKLPITKAYNQGIKLAKYDFLLFIHEDVLFHTQNWGSILVQTFNDNLKVGLIGVAGTRYKSKSPSAFWHTSQKMLCINIMQHYRNRSPNLFKLGFKDSRLEKVVAIDGVFLALRKSTNVTFNEKIDGFHCYDLGISIDVLEKKHQIAVTDRILIEHFSIGNTNIDFVMGVIRFHDLYKSKLPKYIGNRSSNLETIALQRFLGICLENKYIPYKLWMSYLVKFPFNRLNFNMTKLLLYRIRNI